MPPTARRSNVHLTSASLRRRRTWVWNEVSPIVHARSKEGEEAKSEGPVYRFTSDDSDGLSGRCRGFWRGRSRGYDDGSREGSWLARDDTCPQRTTGTAGRGSGGGQSCDGGVRGGASTVTGVCRIPPRTETPRLRPDTSRIPVGWSEVCSFRRVLQYTGSPQCTPLLRGLGQRCE